MFVYSMRAGTLRFFGVVFLALAALVTLIVFVPELQPASAEVSEEVSAVSYEKIKDNENRIDFLSSLGWEVENTPIEDTTVQIPKEFDKVFGAYNELQRSQGLDLTEYAGKTVERYTYKVTNYKEHEGTVYANLLIYRGRVIGGDICSADSNGFIHGFKK